MPTTIKIDPLTRIEGHLKIETKIEPHNDAKAREKFHVQSAYCSGQMFRGFEVLLEGRDPLDAQQITQRICGVCPIPHGIASCIAQEIAYRAEPSHNGRLLQNLVFVGNFLHSHIMHFYQLVAPDFIQPEAILQYKGNDSKLKAFRDWAQSELRDNKLNALAPFLPRYKGDYVDNVELNIAFLEHYLKALEIRIKADEMTAIFGGKMPHAITLIPTGVTATPEIQRILGFKSRLEKIIDFIDHDYLPDVVALAKAYPQYFKIGKGPDNFLCVGGFRETDGDMFYKPGVLIANNLESFSPEQITEDVRYSYYSSRSRTHPFESETKADPQKTGAYSWLKAARYRRKVMQVGPHARMIVQYRLKNRPELNQLLDKTMEEMGGKIDDINSVMGRHLARAIEAKMLAEKALVWLEQLRPGDSPSNDFDIPAEGRGFACVEAPRGALGHWIRIKNYLIEGYQCVVPTTWNCSPRDDDGQPGAVEQALDGCLLADPENPIELGRIVRSFDPCLACSIH